MIGIIGGTGLTQLFDAGGESGPALVSRFGAASSAVTYYRMGGQRVAFLPRHGHPHSVAPHLINYRANLDLLRLAGVTRIFAVNAVGGIHPDFPPAQLAIPDQIIDYTYGREHTIYDGTSSRLDHIDMGSPYCELLRRALLQSIDCAALDSLRSGTYAATQGPRLETAAEIQRIKADGCDMVGMTGMPEASLAREMTIDYACLALSVNWAAGIVDQVITMEDIHAALSQGMGNVISVLKKAVELIGE